MPTPSVYLDENVNQRLVEALRKRGFSVDSAVGDGLRGVDDEQQLLHATATTRMLLTHNGKHFRRLHALFKDRRQAHGGIIILPERSGFERLVTRAAMMLEWIATLPEMRPALFTWGQLQPLLESGHRLPGYSEAEVQIVIGQREA